MISHPMLARRRRTVWMFLFDLFVLVVCVSGLYSWRVHQGPWLELWSRPSSWLFVGILLLLMYVFGGYEVETFTRSREAFTRLGWVIAFFASFSTLVVYLGFDERAGLLGRGVLLGSLFIFYLISGTLRWCVFKSIIISQSKSKWIFVVSPLWLDRLKRDLVTANPKGSFIFLSEATLQELPNHLKENNVGIVVGLERKAFDQNQELFSQLLQARVLGHFVMDLGSFYERFWQKVPVQVIAPEWLIQAEGFGLFRAPIQMKVKRVFDLFLAVVLGILLLPILLLTGLIVRLESQGPILYRQVRTGRGGLPFTIYKFRSMRQDAEKDGARWAQVGDPRITTIGHFLRKSRIDELPQIFNVLKGEMSFIGPRPERPEFNEKLDKQIPFYDLRHLVSPGITGWAQILYPYGASVEDAWEKLQYDLFYIKNYSFWLDVRIALKTARVMIMGRGR